ncbi:hypothetical protein PPTG_11341 [Phytophthora nicotianae INRA-310]|uniref:Uncharacterized protein n=1 Tax=Phytophthora nicotianae (strain INRA-310) TaxID=761204 RepID=W2Q978_PHYN3|nr:hypothetical protein PPTG_11341 [Phytophthora nicotianae INRA-310]ETN09738.1 hypothetical protein PPTG_11341 [Phytophthora nicotianae INRA-310]
MASLGDDQAAAELLDEVDAELREQAAEESANVFVSIKDLPHFAKTMDTGPGVLVSVIIDTRVTLVDGLMQPHWKSYNRKLSAMDPFRKDTRVVKITVWDPRVRSVTRPRFQLGTIYELKKIHALKFYHDVLQGSLQAVGSNDPWVIREYGDFEAVKRARTEEATPLTNEGDEDEEEKEEEPME